MKKIEKKIIEFDIDQEEFDKCVIGGALEALQTTDEHVLYGNTFGDDIKYKKYTKDGVETLKIVQIVTEEVACGKCHIKIHSGYYDKCPVCDTTLPRLVTLNRIFNDRMHDFNMSQNKIFQEEHIKFQAELVEECGFDF